MKLVSWNVNGIRAVLNKGFKEYFDSVDADIFCVQETKCQVGQVEIETPGYYQYFHSGERKGYSSTAIFTKKKPLSVTYDFPSNPDHPKEGRIITLEFENFYLVNAYVPNSQDGLKRLDYRSSWEADMLEHLKKLNENKPVVYCGDLNVAKEEIDIKNPNANHFNAGFSDREREMMRRLLANGFVDSYRYLYPEKVEYSWWSYRFNARANNAGWRIDYFIVSDEIKDKIIDSRIRNDIYGSDHCPIEMDVNL